MRRGKFDSLVSVTRLKLIRVLMGAILLYMLLMSLEIPLVFRTGSGSVPGDGFNGFINDALVKPLGIQIEEEFRAQKESKKGPTKIPSRVSKSLSQFQTQKRRIGESKMVSGLAFSRDSALDGKNGVPELQKSAKRAWVVGNKLWEELNSGKIDLELVNKTENWSGTCPDSILLSGSEFGKQGKVMAIPCGLTLGSNIALVGKPQLAHAEYDPKISEWRNGNQPVMVSQFMMELQGLDTVDGEELPRILHFNPRLKGDWSKKPVIELNTRYRMQWGLAFRCEGWKSKADEETVDGQVKCEKWIRDDDDHSEESKTVWWLSRLVGQTKKVTVDWPYPFVEDKLFILTLRAGLEGYHINVDGRHVTSFPYRTGFTLEDATGLSLNGDIDVYSIVSASLPTSHPSSASEKLLEMLSQFQAPPLPSGPVDIFIGVLSAGNHFAERMATRKTWMRHESIRASNVVARFFVALHGRKEVNLELKKEAEYFGDVVIVPYMDHYDLVVLKTVAICEYGVRTVAAKYIMKCDDDTFVRVEAVIKMVVKLPGDGRSLYFGNINYYHRPLRYGKWEVTYEEWPEENYPPYANGPGYIVSSDIAHFIVSEFEKHKLRLFKMEDVSMGMWVQKFNTSLPVEYVHSDKFCQFGCIENYYTAHYQSPRQMMCLWDKLKNQGIPRCCDAT